MKSVLDAVRKVFPDATEGQMSQLERLLSKKKAHQVPASLKPVIDGNDWERRLFAFDIFRKRYPGTKGGLVVEFNNFLKVCNANGMDIDFRISALPWNLKYQVELRQVMKDDGEFVPSWKNLRTWVNQQCWDDVNELLPKSAWMKRQVHLSEAEYKQYDVTHILPKISKE